MIELTFLGSGNAFAQGGRYWSSFLANGRYLFDAPPTLLPHLRRVGVPLEGIDVIFLTHLHGDHFMGLPFLLLDYLYLTERRHDLIIVGPPGVEEAMESFTERCFPNATREAGYRRLYLEARPGEEQRAGDVSFQAFPMQHASGALQCFGYRARIGESTLAYTGDTAPCEEVFRLAEEAQVLVLDCTYSQGSGPEHIGLDDLPTIRKRLPPQMTLILTHLDGEPRVADLPNVIVARDFATYRFP